MCIPYEQMQCYHNKIHGRWLANINRPNERIFTNLILIIYTITKLCHEVFVQQFRARSTIITIIRLCILFMFILCLCTFLFESLFSYTYIYIYYFHHHLIGISRVNSTVGGRKQCEKSHFDPPRNVSQMTSRLNRSCRILLSFFLLVIAHVATVCHRRKDTFILVIFCSHFQFIFLLFFYFSLCLRAMGPTVFLYFQNTYTHKFIYNIYICV